ncbi:hypothetical protein HGB07_08330 [Candidatus Roizmanbacteria bacterium]|nr:hypothetical protein [Candidatus Roizmanbacteria bacterium]
MSVLKQAQTEANNLNLTDELQKVVAGLENRRKLKGFKKIQPETANTYEARLTIKYRAFMVFDSDNVIIFHVGDHLR